MAALTASRALAPIGTAGKLFAFALDVARGLFRRPFQTREFFQQAWFIASVTIVPTALVAIPFGAVIALQVGGLIQQFGAQSFTGSASVLAVVREAGPIATSLLIAGAGGSAIAADLGARKIREELDAMMVLGIDPIQRLVVPRVLATMLVAVFLNGLVSVVGVAGGYVFNVMLQDGTPGAYLASFTALAQLPSNAEHEAIRYSTSTPADAIARLQRDIDAGARTLEFEPGHGYLRSVLRALDIPYLALNPGASYRGLHDSIVNYLGNERPQMLLCLHEEAAVAIAHGYAKASGRMMGVVLHSNVGLMHGSMAIFNAWCDRMPMLILGATGPWDAARRRPWIDWIHTASDQGALVRDYTKWDDFPWSLTHFAESAVRAYQVAMTPPMAPVVLVLDGELQERPIPGGERLAQDLHANGPGDRVRALLGEGAWHRSACW